MWGGAGGFLEHIDAESFLGRSSAGILPLKKECAAEVQQKRVILSEFCCTLCERVRGAGGEPLIRDCFKNLWSERVFLRAPASVLRGTGAITTVEGVGETLSVFSGSTADRYT